MTLGCGETRFDRVPSAQIRRFAGENPAPAVVAGHVHALAGAGLRHRRAGGAQRECRYQNGELKRPRDHHAVLHRWVATYRRRSWPDFGSRPDNAPIIRRGDDKNYRINSMNWGNFGRRARPPLQNQSCPFKRGPPERWPSGLRRTLGKRVCGKPYRGFESHPLRQASHSGRRTTSHKIKKFG